MRGGAGDSCQTHWYRSWAGPFAYLYFKTRRWWPSLLPVLGTALGVLLYFSYNLYRFGRVRAFTPDGTSPSDFSGRAGGFADQSGWRIAVVLPLRILCILALRKITSRQLEVWTIVALSSAFLLLHSLWIAWSGGSSVGTAFAAAGTTRAGGPDGHPEMGWAQTAGTAALIGFLVNIPTMFSFYKRYISEAGERNRVFQSHVGTRAVAIDSRVAGGLPPGSGRSSRGRA